MDKSSKNWEEYSREMSSWIQSKKAEMKSQKSSFISSRSLSNAEVAKLEEISSFVWQNR